MWSVANLEAIAISLAETTTGRGISDYFTNSPIRGYCCESSTKWKRLKAYFICAQNQLGNDSRVKEAIVHFMNPALFLRRRDEYNICRRNLNEALSMVGLELTEKGVLREVTKAETLDEAQQKAQSLLRKVRERNMHHNIEYYCKSDLLREDYYDVVFEATKGIFDRIRELSFCRQLDGEKLIQSVFNISTPFLVFNGLVTESEQSEHKGFANLLRGVYGTFRNPTAHEIKLKWRSNEVQVLEILATVSLIHRFLDQARPTCIAYQNKNF